VSGFRKIVADRRRRFLSPPLGFQHGRYGFTVGRFPFLVWVIYFLMAHVTLRVILFGIFGVAPTAFLLLVGFQSGIFLVGFAVTAWVLISLIVGFVICPRVNVSAKMAERVECGLRFEIEYELFNRGRSVARDIEVETLTYPGISCLKMESMPVEDIPAGESVTVPGKGRARVRGVYTLPGLRWDTDYPCGFWRWGRTVGETRVLHVYPRYTRLESLDIPLGTGDRSELSSENKLSREAFEFHGCREFREGDLLRHVHPRSSARLGVPVVKEFQSEGRLRTAVLVDTRKSALSGSIQYRLLQNSPLEAALSLATSIVDFLSTTDRVLELLIAGPEVYRFVSEGRIGYFEEALDIFAAIEPCRGDPFDKLEPILLEEIRLIQSVCLVLTGWDDRRAALIRELDTYGVGVKIVVVTSNGKKPDGLPVDIACFSARDVLKGGVCSL